VHTQHSTRVLTLTLVRVPFLPRPPTRHSLRQVLSWCVQRDIFYSELARIRDEFEKHRAVSVPSFACCVVCLCAHTTRGASVCVSQADPVTAERLLKAGEARLKEYAHPDQYTIPYAVGGSKYARNPPVPPQVHVTLNFGREEGTY